MKGQREPGAERPEGAVGFEPGEFGSALRCAAEMANAPGVIAVDRSGEQLPLAEKLRRSGSALKDSPMTRAALSVAIRFRWDQRKYLSFMWRFMALNELLASGVLAPQFQRPGGGGFPLIHAAVIGLAATFPLTRQGKFEHCDFLRTLWSSVARGGMVPGMGN